MQEGGFALAAGIFAVHILVAVALLMILWGVRRRLVRGRPPTRDLRPYEIAYLGGLDLGAVAASLAALLLDGAIEARADGRLAATGTSSGGPGEPLDAAIRGVLADGRSRTLGELTGEPAVRAELDRLRDGLGEQRLMLHRPARRRLWPFRIAYFGWLLLGFSVHVGEAVATGYEGLIAVVMLIPVSVILALAGIGAGGAFTERTVEGERALEQAGEAYADLDPGTVPSYAELDGSAIVMGVAVFGRAALLAYDPVFAQTVGLDPYRRQSRSTASSGFSGTSCAASTAVCSTSSCGSSCGGGGGCGGGGA